MDRDKTILVTDDNANIRMIMKEILSRGGYRTLLAKNGKEALDIAAREKIDMFFMDVDMPEMNGIEALKELRSTDRHADTPVTIMTGMPTSDVRDKAVDAGTTNFMSKPIPMSSMIDNIKASLN